MAKFTPSPSQTLGPFYAYGLLTDADRVLAGPAAKGDRVTLTGRLVGRDGNPARDALIELWQADADGRMSGRDADADPDFKGFGRTLTDGDGVFAFETVTPGASAGEGNSAQAPHFALSVFSAGLTRRLVTRAYVPDRPELETDSLLEAVAEDMRPRLMAKADGAKLIVNLNIAGENATPFFTD